MSISCALSRQSYPATPGAENTAVALAVSKSTHYIATICDGKTRIVISHIANHQGPRDVGRLIADDTDGRITALAFVEPPSVPGTDDEVVLLAGTDTGALMVAGVDGNVRSVASLGPAPIVSIACCDGKLPLAENPGCFVTGAAANAVVVTCSNGVCLVIPSASFAGLPRMSRSQPRPLLSDPAPKDSRATSKAQTVVAHGLNTWLTGSELLHLGSVANDNGASDRMFSSATMFVTRSNAPLLGIQASSVSSERFIVASGKGFTAAFYRLSAEQAGKTTADLVAAVAGKIGTAAAGFIRGLWSSPTSSTAAASAAIACPAVDALELAGSCLRSIVVDPSQRFAAGVDPQRNRVVLLDVESCAVIRIFKGCRSAHVGWVRTASGTNLLLIYLGFRGAVEVFSPHSAERLTAAVAPKQRFLGTSSTSMFLVSPDRSLEVITPLRSRACDPPDNKDQHVVPASFRGTLPQLIALVQQAARNCVRDPSHILRLVQSIPLNLPPEHISSVLDAVEQTLPAADIDNDVVTMTEEEINGAAPISLAQARHYVTSMKSVLRALSDLLGMPALPPLPNENEIVSTRSTSARALCAAALASVEDELSSRASALLFRTLKAAPQVRSYSRMTPPQFLKCFDLSSYKPRMRSGLSAAQRVQLGELLFATPNGHPLGSTAEHRLALGITDAEARELFLTWLIEKYSVAGWLLSPHFQISIHSLKECAASVVESACVAACVHETLVPWLCAIKAHVMRNTGNDSTTTKAMLTVIEQASVIHELTQNPIVPPATFDLNFAREHSLFVAICMPFVSRLSAQSDEEWLDPVLRIAEATSTVLSCGVEPLLFGLACYTIRSFDIDVNWDKDSDNGLSHSHRLLQLLEPQICKPKWIALCAQAVQSAAARLALRTTGAANLSAIVGDSQRRGVVKTLELTISICGLARGATLVNGETHADDAGSKPAPSTSFAAMRRDDARVFGEACRTGARDVQRWMERLSTVCTILHILLHESLAQGDAVTFPWASLDVACLRDVGSHPRDIATRDIEQWIEEQAHTSQPPYEAMSAIAATTGRIPVDFVALLRLAQRLRRGDDDAVLSEDLPRINDRIGAARLVLSEVGRRIGHALKQLAKTRGRKIPTHALVSELPAAAREWIAEVSSNSAAEEGQEIGPTTQELAYAVAECPELEIEHPW
eukprot:CAMPEP_0174844854 /NCGR_PEP_ID=MMETSP1114-20130205/11355_1 /TAXON_ID=312471 /ORGANISM="Neobodo designis, Strain CCAP 1951/1" /LENGTH=1175 /DNA_ID=CAMNT_0016079099 /DNA_START=28 /DNA_END=3552 /DNA_ORIENTATION=+